MTLLCSVLLLNSGLKNSALANKSISHLWSLGLGTVTTESLVRLEIESTVLTIIIANSPQLILSFLYLTYNGLFTCMLLADEWNDYAHHRKALRVTSPAGHQRSTYRLQLPYKYGIPLIILSGLFQAVTRHFSRFTNIRLRCASLAGLAVHLLGQRYGLR